jgi:tRNA dimethylallyltransferase
MNPVDTAKPPLALIAGPTASGKSALALALALAVRTGGTIINADSAQVYRDLRLLSARPDAAEEAKAPHLLYGHRDSAEACSAADWAAEARAAIAAVQAAGGLPILTGGTGLYLRTLIEGIAPVPAIDPQIRAEARALGPGAAHAALRREDPAAADRIRPGDGARAARALEVIRSTGRTLRDWQGTRAGGIGGEVALRPLILLPPRDWLHARCDARLDKIFSDEGIEEVRSLLERRLPALAPVLRAIGVREIAALLAGEITRAEALAAARIATRQYAKRQYTWFSRQPPAAWPRFTRPLDCDAQPDALALLQGG